MAILGGIPLSVDTRSGASFVLSQASPDSWVQSIDGAAEIEIKSGSKVAVVRINPESAYSDAYENALTAGQKGLDLIAMTRGLPLAIESLDSHLVWWSEAGKAVARLTQITVISFDAPPVSARVIDAQGNDVTPPPTPSPWDQSFRYYRLSQITPDIADAYRNMFLMLESILSDIYPFTKGGENAWLKAAFAEAHKQYNLSHFSVLRQGHEGEDLHADFATDARHPISHAKRQRNTSLPLDLSLRTTLVDKLQRLGALCLHLAEQHFKVRRIQGGVFPAWIKLNLEQQSTAASLILNNEERELDPTAQTIPVAPEAKSVWVSAQRNQQYEDPYRYALYGEASAKELVDIDEIRRVICTLDGATPLSEGRFEEPLTPDGIGTLQLVMGIHVRNSRNNRRDYSL